MHKFTLLMQKHYKDGTPILRGVIGNMLGFVIDEFEGSSICILEVSMFSNVRVEEQEKEEMNQVNFFIPDEQGEDGARWFEQHKATLKNLLEISDLTIIHTEVEESEPAPEPDIEP